MLIKSTERSSLKSMFYHCCCLCYFFFIHINRKNALVGILMMVWRLPATFFFSELPWIWSWIPKAIYLENEFFYGFRLLFWNFNFLEIEIEWKKYDSKRKINWITTQKRIASKKSSLRKTLGNSIYSTWTKQNKQQKKWNEKNSSNAKKKCNSNQRLGKIIQVLFSEFLRNFNATLIALSHFSRLCLFKNKNKNISFPLLPI